MTVSSSTNRASYSGNGSLATFAYGFKVFDQDDLTVILRASDGTETVQTITTDYTVTGVGDVGGGNVVFNTAPASGVTVVIIREQPLTQGLDLVPNDPFPAQSLEESLDKLTFVDQRLSESIDRALTFSVGDFVTDATLPFKEQRVGTVLAFNETTGDPEVGPTIADTQSIANVSADIALLADIEDGTLETNAITNINGIRTDVTTVSGISANVTTVATNNANVTTVADNDADITTVATNISSVNTVATNISDVIAVANDLNEAVSEVETVANDLNEAISEIETVAASIANVDLVGTDITNVNTIAGSISNVNTTAANIADVNTVAGISGNVTTVAGITADIATVVADGADIGTVAGISADVTAVANNSANVSAVANNSTNINTVAGQTTNLQNVTDNLSEIQGAAANASAAATSATAASDSAAAAAAAFDSFDDKYLGSKTGYADSGTGPTTDNDGNALVEGSLFFSSDANEMRVYDGANWIAASSAGSASLILYEFTATSGQTTFSGADDNGATFGYTTGNAQFVLNGVILDPSDVTATDGTSVVLASGAATGDLLNIYAFKSFTVADTVSASAGGTFAGNVTFNGTFTSQGIDDNATSTAMTLDSSGNVGIGTSSPTAVLDVRRGDADGKIAEFHQSTGYGFELSSSQSVATITAGYYQAFAFETGATATERMRIDSSGNLLVGKTANNLTDDGIVLRGTGELFVTRANDVAAFNRRSSDGNIVTFRKDGSTVGSIGVQGGRPYFGNTINFGIKADDANNGCIIPCNQTGTPNDNTSDIGHPANRFDDIYATNGTIQTSDRNEKQDIEALNDAETRVAQACKGLLRKFRWQDAVAEKGDDARIHFGIIAQDLQDAFAAEGLDAGRYAMFISSTWWETQTEVPAVEAVEAVEATYDEDGNELTPAVEAVEAKEAYTRTDTYETQEEAPEGATERTRLGVRYPELLAFIIAAI